MKIIKYTKNVGISLMFMLTMNSCSSWLDLKPIDRVTEEQLYKTVNGFRSALNGIYIELNSSDLYGDNMLCGAIDLLANIYNVPTVSNNSNYMVSSFQYSNGSTLAIFDNIWKKSYAIIANCNKLLENADKKAELFNPLDKGLIVGEAIALRAYIHFDLLRLYGPIYATDANENSICYNTESKLSHTSFLPAKEVINRILTDLKTAEEMLKDVDPIIEKGIQAEDSNDGLNYYTYRNQRFNYYAVKALQARVYLYAGMKREALNAAKAVTEVQSKHFPFITYERIVGNKLDPDRVFSTELLFCQVNSNRQTIFEGRFRPELTDETLLSPKKSLDHFFGVTKDKDWRYESTWIQPANKSTRFFHKYEDVPNEKYNDIIPLIRMSEMYYIIAETSDDKTEQWNAISTVLVNRGLDQLSVNADIEKAIKEEFMKEFFGEGQLFFYYKRKNMNKIYSAVSDADYPMNKTKYVVPIPKSEVDYH